MEFLTDGDVLILTDSSTLKYVINEMPVSIHLFSVFSNLFKIRSDRSSQTHQGKLKRLIYLFSDRHYRGLYKFHHAMFNGLNFMK